MITLQKYILWSLKISYLSCFDINIFKRPILCSNMLMWWKKYQTELKQENWDFSDYLIHLASIDFDQKSMGEIRYCRLINLKGSNWSIQLSWIEMMTYLDQSRKDLDWSKVKIDTLALLLHPTLNLNRLIKANTFPKPIRMFVNILKPNWKPQYT